MGTDFFQAVDDLDDDTVKTIVQRLEYRAQEPTFAKMRERYFDLLSLKDAANVLDLGCGTGAATRAIARRSDFSGEVTGTDLSHKFIAAAERLANEEGLDQRIKFAAGDGQGDQANDGTYDIVVAHTLVSHVADPEKVIREAKRLLRAGGKFAIFDGDYASLAYAATDNVVADRVIAGAQAAACAHPEIMRHLPAMLKDNGFFVQDGIFDVYVDVGESAFMIGIMEYITPIVIGSGQVDEVDGKTLLADLRKRNEDGRFFGSCNFYAYIAEKQ
jgi:SAM-dependent methyltransferase